MLVIYTTNFDHCIEDYYAMKGKEIQKIVKMDDMVSDKDNLPRIVKFHGDIDDESSIVLTESQYFERMNFDSFLDIMLQADLMKYQVLFLGYSLSDINIKMLLYRSHSRWKNTKVKGRESYIFTATPNAVQRNVFEKHGIVTICNEESDKKKGTELFLRQLVEYAK